MVFSADETSDVGLKRGAPITPDVPTENNAFTGTVQVVVIETDTKENVDRTHFTRGSGEHVDGTAIGCVRSPGTGADVRGFPARRTRDPFRRVQQVVCNLLDAWPHRLNALGGNPLATSEPAVCARAGCSCSSGATRTRTSAGTEDGPSTLGRHFSPPNSRIPQRYCGVLERVTIRPIVLRCSGSRSWTSHRHRIGISEVLSEVVESEWTAQCGGVGSTIRYLSTRTGGLRFILARSASPRQSSPVTRAWSKHETGTSKPAFNYPLNAT